jgi:hypothetical protein
MTHDGDGFRKALNPSYVLLFRSNHINAAQRTSQNRDFIANMAKLGV